MKTLVLTAVFALGSLTAFAQEQQPTQDDTQNEEKMMNDSKDMMDQSKDKSMDKMDKSKDKMDKSKDKMDKAKDKEMKKAQKGFKEVSMDELPESVSTAIEENYPNATVNKAMVNKKMQYKLEATMEDGSTETMMMDKDGNPIKG